MEFRFLGKSLVFLPFVLSGCTDTNRVVAPESERPPLTTAAFSVDHQSSLTAELPTVAKFNIEVDVLGQLQPESEISVRATATTQVEASNPQIFMVFPEIEAARMSRWDSGFRIPSGHRLPRRGARHLSRSPDGQAETTASIIAESPGYYRVVVTAEDPTSPATVDEKGRYILSTTHKEVWLWIQESGGKVTETFDPSLFPPGAIVQPGPIRFRPSRLEAASLLGSTFKMVGTALRGLGILTPSYANYELRYWNYDESQYDPVGGSYYSVTHSDFDGRDRRWIVVGTSTGYSTESGTILFECLGEKHDGSAGPDNNSTIWIYNGSGVSIQGDDSDCDLPQPIQLVMNSAQAHVFTTMQDIVTESRSTFGYSRGDLEVRLNPSAGSYYSGSNDHVVIRSGTGSDDHVWDSWGQFVMAHEYGHALHEKGLA